MNPASDVDPDYMDTETLEQGTYAPLEEYDGESTEILTEKYRRAIEDDL